MRVLLLVSVLSVSACSSLAKPVPPAEGAADPTE